MLFELFDQLRRRLAKAYRLEIDPRGAIEATEESDVKDIQYFAEQYGGVIHAVPAVFVEIGKLDLAQRVKGRWGMSVGVTLHVVTEVASESDYGTPDLALRRHEELALRATDALEGEVVEFKGGCSRPLRATGWSFYARYQGWMVSLIDLETKV